MRGCAPRRVMYSATQRERCERRLRGKKNLPQAIIWKAIISKTAARRALMSWFLARFHLAGFVHARAALE